MSYVCIYPLTESGRLSSDWWAKRSNPTVALSADIRVTKQRNFVPTNNVLFFVLLKHQQLGKITDRVHN